jgi:glycosyltransferase involved in cell wall biosynthesis
MRIAYVTETWHPAINGVVTRLSATVRELQGRGHEILVLAPGAFDQPLEGVSVQGVRSVSIPFIYGGEPWGLPLPSVVRLLDAFSPDVIHAVNPVLLGWSGVLYARRRGIPLACSYHTQVARYAGFYHLGFAERLIWAVISLAHRLADLNLVTSQASATELTARGVGRIRLWRRGIDEHFFRARAASVTMRNRLSDGHPERLLVLYVGRLAAEKGLERLRPLTRRDDLHLALVGDGPARAPVAATLGHGQSTFVGPLRGDELAAAYASADVFVFPSITDTVGLALLEALASGLPVVASRTIAAEELLAGAPAAELVQPGADAELLAATTRLAASGPPRAEIAEDARRRTGTWAEATGDLLRLYDGARRLRRRRSAVT